MLCHLTPFLRLSVYVFKSGDIFQLSARLGAKDYTRLEELANKYRTSKVCYPNGIWKLASVYSGTFPGDGKSDAQWKTSLTALRDWVQAKPESITARIALADALVSYGWNARGTGLANTVTDGGWKLFRERLTESVRVLRQAEGLKEKCPHWHSVLLIAATGLGTEKAQYESLYQKAIVSQPDCADYHFERLSCA